MKCVTKISPILFSAWAGGVFGFTLGLSVLSITEHFLLIGKFFWDVISAMKKNWDLEVYRSSSRNLPSAYEAICLPWKLFRVMSEVSHHFNKIASSEGFCILSTSPLETLSIFTRCKFLKRDRLNLKKPFTKESNQTFSPETCHHFNLAFSR